MDPRTIGRIRGGREAGRETEDDIAKRELGEQGIPGRKPKQQQLDDKTLQNPKPIDPGHTS